MRTLTYIIVVSFLFTPISFSEDPTTELLNEFSQELSEIEVRKQEAVAKAQALAAEERAEEFQQLARDLKRLERRVKRDPAQAASFYRIQLELDPSHQAATDFLEPSDNLRPFKLTLQITHDLIPIYWVSHQGLRKEAEVQWAQLQKAAAN